jgi:hypothetical protein
MKPSLSKFLLVLSIAAPAALGAEARHQAQVLFRTLTGVPLRSDDQRLGRMEAKILRGDLKGAAAIATEDDNFYDVTLVHWASHMSTRDEFQRTPLNDFVATVVGTAADGRDARELLYADAWYVGTNVPGLAEPDGVSNTHYAGLEAARVPLRGHLARRSPQRANAPGAGLLTTWTYLKNHAFRGTNRRLAEFSIREFMCKSMSSIADLGAPRDRVRQDVDRAPGGNTSVFNNKCAGCHGILDAFAGAFAYFNFEFTDQMKKENGVAQYDMRTLSNANVTYTTPYFPKMNSNGANYPAGYRTTDDSFVNYARYGSNEDLGWRGPVSGNGVSEFGRMIASSRQFSRCLASRAYSQLCINVDYAVDRLTKIQVQQLEAAAPQIESLADEFEGSGYNLRSLFGAAAALPKCLDR